MRASLASVLALVAVLTACSPRPVVEDPVRAVRVMTIQPETAGGRREYAAEIRARTESRLGFRVGGKIVRRNVDLGDSVRAGS